MPIVSWSQKASEGLQRIGKDFPNDQSARLREQIINWAGGGGWNVGDERTRSFRISYLDVLARAERISANKTEILNVDPD